MSYLPPSTPTKVSAPGLTDDSSKGYVVGSKLVVTSVTPRTVYVCTSNGIGTATWREL